MNKMKWIFTLGIMGMMGSCHTGDYLNYEEPKEGIYCSGRETISYITTTFDDWEASNTKEAYARFNISGFTADVEREISLELVDSLTTAIEGQDYEVVEHIAIPAESEYAYIPVIRWNRRQEGDDRPDKISVGFRLVENENFRPVTLGGTARQIVYKKTVLQQPKWWDVQYLGLWSADVMYKFLEQYDALAETNPDVYASIQRYAGDHFSKATYWPWQVHYMLSRYILSPLYQYYQAHPELEVDFPEPKYE